MIRKQKYYLENLQILILNDMKTYKCSYCGEEFTEEETEGSICPSCSRSFELTDFEIKEDDNTGRDNKDCS